MFNWLINLFKTKSDVPLAQEQNDVGLNQAAVTLKKHDIKVEYKQVNKVKTDTVKSYNNDSSKSKTDDYLNPLNPLSITSPMNPVYRHYDYSDSSSSSSCSDYSSSSSSSSSSSCD